MTYLTKLLILASLHNFLPNILYANPIKKTTKLKVSEGNRHGKKFELALQPAGLMNIVGFDIGAMAAYYVKPNIHFTLTYTQSDFGLLGIRYQTYFINASMRFFWGNSLNSMIGTGYLTEVKQDNNFYYGDRLENELEYQFTSKSIGLLASIGNRWYWDNVMIGCDWVTIFQPISTTTSVNAEGKEEITEVVSEKKEHDQRAELYSWEFVKFQVGITF